MLVSAGRPLLCCLLRVGDRVPTGIVHTKQSMFFFLFAQEARNAAAKGEGRSVVPGGMKAAKSDFNKCVCFLHFAPVTHGRVACAYCGSPTVTSETLVYVGSMNMLSYICSV